MTMDNEEFDHFLEECPDENLINFDHLPSVDDLWISPRQHESSTTTDEEIIHDQYLPRDDPDINLVVQNNDVIAVESPHHQKKRKKKVSTPATNATQLATHAQDNDRRRDNLVALYISCRYHKVKDFASIFVSQFNYRDIKNMKKYFSSYARPSCVLKLSKLSSAKHEYNPHDILSFIGEMEAVTDMFPNMALLPRKTRLQSATNSKHTMITIKMLTALSAKVQDLLQFTKGRGDCTNIVDIMDQTSLSAEQIDHIKQVEKAVRNADITIQVTGKIRIRVIIDDVQADIVSFEMFTTVASFRISTSSLPRFAAMLTDEMLGLESSENAVTEKQREELLMSLPSEMQFMLLLKRFGITPPAQMIPK